MPPRFRSSARWIPFRYTMIALAALLAVSCSEKSKTDRPHSSKSEKQPTPGTPVATPAGPSGEAEDEAKEKTAEAAPETEEIGEDCVAFLRSTKATPLHAQNTDCPHCPSDAAVEVLRFDDFTVEHIKPSPTTCEVIVAIKAQFNPSAGGRIGGGLTGWITPEQREQYERGETPTEQQIYHVRIFYRHTGAVWKAIEFDRP
ncbi:MAG: hypothetical protein ABI992_00755 [Chthoniobacterales bacterium]